MCTSEQQPETAISNGLVHARLYLPDPGTGYYRGTRFDWSGAVGSLVYRGHEYFGPWFDTADAKVYDFVYEAEKVVAGPCNAIGGPVDEFPVPLGYDEAPPGGTFIKIGVGVLRRPDQAGYDHHRLYEVVDPGSWAVRIAPDHVEFAQTLTDVYVYRKTVRLAKDEPRMTLEHSLRNTGRRAIEGSVYNHNFLVLDGQAPGPDFSIAFGSEIRAIQPPDARLARISENRIVYLKTLENDECAWADLRASGDIRIDNAKLGAGVRISADRPLESVFLWSIRSVLSLEPYVAIAVEPGGEFTWEFSYTFI